MKKIYFLLVMCVITTGVWSQIAYTWNVAGGGAWNAGANWLPPGIPGLGDNVTFNNGGAKTITAVPAVVLTTFTVAGNTNITLQPAVANNTVTLNGGINALSVAAGSALNISGAAVLNIAVAPGSKGSISGTMDFAGAAHTLQSADASSLTFNNAATFTANTGFTGTAFGTTNLNSVIFASGSKYFSNAGLAPFGAAQPNSVVVFQTGSRFVFQQNANPDASGRTYADFEFNPPLTLIIRTMSGASPVTMDSLIITKGKLVLDMQNTGNSIKGNIRTVTTTDTLKFTPSAGTSTFTLNGTSKQTISGNAPLFPSSAAGVQHITINNAAGVDINTSNDISLQPNGTLTLTNGVVTLLNGRTLTIANRNPDNSPTPGITAGNDNSYIFAPGPFSNTAFLRRLFGNGVATPPLPAVPAPVAGDQFYFPVGDDFEPITLEIESFGSAGVPEFSARFLGIAGGSNGLPLVEGDNIQSTSKCGIFEVRHVSVDLVAKITCVAQNLCDITDYTKLHLLTRSNAVDPTSGVPWLLAGTHVATTGSNASAVLVRSSVNFASLAGIVQFGAGAPVTALPITLESFAGQKEGSHNLLRWTTAGESNNLGFEVQRSTDGMNYDALGFVNTLAPDGNSTNRLSYTFTDNTPAPKSYYRLLMKGKNARTKFSEVILIKGETGSLAIDGLFPNPSVEKINVMLSSPRADRITLRVNDINGKLVIQKMINMETGNNTIPVDISSLQSGNYVLRIINTGTNESVISKFVKQ